VDATFENPQSAPVSISTVVDCGKLVGTPTDWPGIRAAAWIKQGSRYIVSKTSLTAAKNLLTNCGKVREFGCELGIRNNTKFVKGISK